MPFKKYIRATARVPVIRKLIARNFAKAHVFWKTMEHDRLVNIYLQYKDSTRLHAESLVANLEVIQNHLNVEGCVVECGCWRGGMSAAMADLLGPDRTYYLFDSFEGLPQAREIDGASASEWQSRNRIENCRTQITFAKEAMQRSRAKSYHVIKGWFDDTLPNFSFDAPIAVLRIDADWYSSTAECLNSLFPLVSKGGLIIIDDYFIWDGCSRAVHDYLSKNALSDRIQCVDRLFAYIIKHDVGQTTTIDPNRDLKLHLHEKNHENGS